jgi:hypothetical protein
MAGLKAGRAMNGPRGRRRMLPFAEAEIAKSFGDDELFGERPFFWVKKIGWAL